MRAVATYTNMGSAGLALSVLEGAGIAAHLENLESSVNLSGGPPAIRIVVDDADLEAAGELLHNPPAPPSGES